LRIGYSYNGPTEIGGLIVLPQYRKAPERLGRIISYARFLFIASRRPLFRDEILAELLPPLESDGTSHLWEALGRHFTSLSYAEADFLSKKNKEFIKSLFPDGVVYASLLPRSAQDVIGKVGAQTRGVEKLLKRIGFRYADRIDPFDGGPHFTAPTDEIALIQRTRRARLADVSATGTAGAMKGLCAKELPISPFIRIVMAEMRDLGERGVSIDADTARHLDLKPGDEIVTLPLD
jgi:arginine N-succinyltransferase